MINKSLEQNARKSDWQHAAAAGRGLQRRYQLARTRFAIARDDAARRVQAAVPSIPHKIDFEGNLFSEEMRGIEPRNVGLKLHTNRRRLFRLCELSSAT